MPKTIVVTQSAYGQTSRGINAALQEAGSNSEIILTPGTYSIVSPIVINGVHNITLRIMSGTKLIADPTDFDSSVSIISVTRSSFINIVGENGIEIDGLGTPRDCVTINAPGLTDKIGVFHVEVSGLNCTRTIDGIDAGDSKNFKMDTRDIEIDHNTVSHTAGPGQINVQGTVQVDIHDNTLESPGIGQNQIVCSTTIGCDVHGNVLRGFVPSPDGNPQAAINGYFCQKCAWHDNVIHGVSEEMTSGWGFGDIYCDTCFDSTFNKNELVGGIWGITCEICRNVVIASNVLKNQLYTAIQLYGSTQFRTVNSFQSASGLEAGPNVVLAQDAPYGHIASLSAGFSSMPRGGVIFQQNVDPPGQPDLRLYIMSSRRLQANTIGFRYCSEQGLLGTCTTLPFGPIGRSWTLEDRRYPVSPPFSNYDSYAIVALTDMTSTVLRFRDLEADRIAEYAMVERNHIVQPRIWGISVYEGYQNYSIIMNSCEGLGHGSEATEPACIVISDDNNSGHRYLLQYGIVENNRATPDPLAVATTYGIRAYALGTSVNDTLLVLGNRLDLRNAYFFSRVSHLILGPLSLPSESLGLRHRTTAHIEQGSN